MHYTVYKTTNTINGKFYIGAHRTIDPDDDYIGSGKAIRRAIQKYGKESFQKTVLFVFDNPDDMMTKEAELVTQAVVDNRDSYNLIPGGYQGNRYYQALKNIPPEKRREWARRAYNAREITRDQLVEWGRKGGAISGPARSQAWLEDFAAKGREAQGGNMRPPCWEGQTHTEEAKAKISRAAKKRMRSQGNHCLGTRWVWHPEDGEKKIPKTNPLEPGWVYGRHPKTTKKLKDNSTKGRKDSPETRALKSQRMKESWKRRKK